MYVFPLYIFKGHPDEDDTSRDQLENMPGQDTERAGGIFEIFHISI